MTEYDNDSTLRNIVEAALGRKAIDLMLLDVRKVTDVADFFMICSGRSNRQVTAIAEYIEKQLRKAGIKPLSSEGYKEGHWALLDYGHVIVHIFYEPIRLFYDIEGLWTDAEHIDLKEIVDTTEAGEDTGVIDE